MFISVYCLWSGKENIKGLVTDEKNEPLIGVSVVEVGTSNGTITDVDGKFEIKFHQIRL